MSTTRFLALLFIFPNVLFAQVEIIEIMYDLEGSDAGREWIEVVNTGGVSVDIADFKFFEAETNHKLILSQGDSNLEAGGYAVIADNTDTFLADWPNYSGVLFDSSFSLKNTGEFLAFRNSELVDIDSVTYSSEWGAEGDGNSLQLTNSEWLAGSPTPGGINTASTVVLLEASEPSEESQTVQTVQTTSINSSFSTELQIKAYGGENRTVIVGADTEFRGEALGLKDEPLSGARYQWNMGNGELKEGQAILHSYHYPGEYIVVLTVSSGQYAASDRLIVVAKGAQVSISKTNADLIELTNESDVELNLSWWILRAGKELFTIPKDTLILAGKSLVFSNEVTKLAVADPFDVALLYPNGIEAFHYDNVFDSNEQISTGAENISSISIQTIDTKEEGNEDDVKSIESSTVKTSVEEEPGLENEENLGNTQVALSLSGAEYADEYGNSGIYKWLLILVSIISIAAIGVLLGRRQKDEEEIEILD